MMNYELLGLGVKVCAGSQQERGEPDLTCPLARVVGVFALLSEEAKCEVVSFRELQKRPCQLLFQA